MNQSSTTPIRKATPKATTLRQKIALSLFGLLGFALIMLCVEIALSLLRVGDPYLYEDPFVGFAPGRDLFSKTTLTDGQEVYATNPDKLGFFNEQQFPVDKTPGTYRVFAVGGSTTAGRPYDARVAFARWIQLYLEDMDPSRRWEVVNAGGVSYASYRIALLMKELVHYSPDLFVIYTGHNEFLEERTYAEIIHRPAAVKKLQIWLNGLRSYTLARRAWSRIGSDDRTVPTTLESEVATRLDGWTGLDLYHRDDALEASVLEHFEFNLRQMIALARSHGADVILVKPVSNLKDFSPFKSEHTAGLSAEQRERFDSLLEQGRALLADHSYEAGLAILEEALSIDPGFADLHFRIGRGHLGLGREPEARNALLAARELDVAPLRAVQGILDAIESVALEYDVPLIDLPTILEERTAEIAGVAIPGNELLLDHVHPDIATHSLLARRIIDLLIDDGVVQVAPTWNETAAIAVYDGVVASIDQAYYARRDLNLSKVLGWAGKLEEAEVPLRRAAELLDHDPEVHLNLGIVFQRTGRFAEALPALERAVALAPGLPQAHFNLGVVYGHLDRLQDGIDALRRAIALQDDYAEAYFDLGVLLRRQGAAQASVEALGKALLLRSDSPEVHRNLALALRDLERWDEALEALERALELDDGDIDSLTELGITLARQGNLDEANSVLARAIDREALNAKAHYNLGVVYSQQGLPEEAAASYRRAVEIDPGHAEALNNLGILYARQGKMDAASQALRRALEGDPDYAEAHFNLGIVYDNLGRAGDARRNLERAVALEPNNPSFHFGLATLLYGTGELTAALEHFRRAADGGLDVPAELLDELAARTGR